MTESLLQYTLAAFSIVDLERKAREFEARELQKEEARISYEKNPNFNDFLEGKVIYSQALYELYYEDYEIQLQTFIDDQELFSEE